MIEAVLKSLSHLVQKPALKNIPEPTSWHLEQRREDLVIEVFTQFDL